MFNHNFEQIKKSVTYREAVKISKMATLKVCKCVDWPQDFRAPKVANVYTLSHLVTNTTTDINSMPYVTDRVHRLPWRDTGTSPKANVINLW